MIKDYIDKMNKFSESLPSKKVNVTVRRTAEVDILASRLARKHSKEATTTACLWVLSCSILDHYQTAKGIDTQPMKDMLCDSLKLWCEKNHAPMSEAMDALQEIRKSGEVAGYLAAIPD